MTKKARKFCYFALGGIGVAAVLLIHYKERNSYRCEICQARKDVFQWRLGTWRGLSMPLTPRWERIAETNFLCDFLPPGHMHKWEYAQGSPYYFFGTKWGGCAIGGGRHVSDLCQLYERSPEFRAFVSKEIEKGTLAKSNVIAMATTPWSSTPSATQKAADALMEAFLAQ